ncbi:GNAT family N-acetyltransferase [Paenibacillus sp. GCM10023248]|uniref:GNAT family N-acetyltransferase n=1 Tax=Bacillales TaxID=1385 RepID=UPI0023796D20|nr:MULTISPECIES: GNAT family N-acetyltransferase [Bacillales]MDD9270209.1 GNAT family N-acetyltransferase [Paenibacillus sp. MAHUQ-63]MDR6880343.1 phosphinothricin acetyltransferase [Bacillus sp. 3255]
MSTIHFKPLESSDIPALMDIYNYFVMNSTASFHTEPVELSEFTESVVHTNPRFQTYVITLDDDDELQGYVQVMPHKKKQAYSTTGEVTIYLQPSCVGRGVGSAAIQFIEAFAKEHGFHSLISTICAENKPSIHMFSKNGYSQCAHFREVGFKWGKFLDIVTYQKIIS